MEIQKQMIETEGELKKKIDLVEMKFMNNLCLLKKAETGSMSREEITAKIEKLKVTSDDRYQLQKKEIEEQKKQLNSVLEIEKKIRRLMREISNTEKGGTKANQNQSFEKKMSYNMNPDDIKRDVLILEEKYKHLNELVNTLKNQFNLIEDFYIKLQQMMKANQQETISIFTGN